MPFATGPSAVGILPKGDGTFAALEKLIPNPDRADHGVGSTGHHLDEMSPAAATQLRIELNNWLDGGGTDDPTKAVVEDGQELTIPITGDVGTKITFTVAGGVITAGVLS